MMPTLPCFYVIEVPSNIELSYAPVQPELGHKSFECAIEAVVADIEAADVGHIGDTHLKHHSAWLTEATARQIHRHGQSLGIPGDSQQQSSGTRWGDT